MTTDQLITTVAEKAGITKASAKSAIAAVFKAIKEDVKAGNSTRVVDFGTFSKGHRAARQGVNPSTGAKIQIEAKDTLKVKASSTFF